MDALILLTDENSPTVAGVTVLDRLVVALHRGGCRRITLCGGRWTPGLRRSAALGIAVGHVRSLPVIEEPTVIARSDILVTAADVRRLINESGRLRGRDGELLDLAVLEPGDVVGGSANFANAVALPAQGVARRVKDAAEADSAARELWASLGSACDGVVDRFFNRPVGRPLSKLLAGTPVTPNQISVLATLVGLAGAVGFAWGGYWPVLIGAVVFQISAVIDCIDGDLARIAFKESPLGKWLDLIGDNVVHIAVFVGLGVGLWRASVNGPVAALTASAVVGVVLSLLVVIRAGRMPASAARSRLQGLIDRMTNRDFSVLLLGLAVVDHVEWFLWMLAIGVHVFWLLALGLQFGGGKDAAE